MTKRPLRGALRGFLFLALTAVLLLAYLPAIVLGKRATLAMRRRWCRISTWIVGARVAVAGRPFVACPTLYVANHVSYLDILVLGAVLDGTFIAKSEIASWPLFGLLGRLTRTLFIRRHWRSALIQRNALAARMRLGESFILFGEGTSSNGLGVLPIKTSLLSVAEPWILDCPVAVQPVTLVFARMADGLPIGRENCDLYAWHSDSEFLPHLWNTLQHPGLEIRVVMGDPVLSWSVQNRKVLGRELRMQLSRDLARGQAAAGAEATQPEGERHVAEFG
ncbi:MAG: lysophospholipid acyltransferase family protein [Geminicoccaceae bacterium]